jgi:hypothetical protein
MEKQSFEKHSLKKSEKTIDSARATRTALSSSCFYAKHHIRRTEAQYSSG